MNHNRKVVLRVVIGLLVLCAISVLVTYVVLRPARAIGPEQQRNTEPEPESDVPAPDPATVYINGTLYRCVCDPEGAYIEISVAEESDSQGDAALSNAAWVNCDGTFYRCECGSGEASMEIVVPTLTLSPETSTPGQAIRVIGADFAPETTVVLRLGVANAGLSKENLATSVADADGAFEVELTLPTEWPGAQTPIVERELVIAAVDEARGQTLASAQFTNEEGQPTLALNPGIGTPGQTIRISGGSFVPETRVALRLGVPNAGLSKENLATAVADAHGAFEVELKLPTEWPGAKTPIVERELVIAAVDEARSQTLAVAQFTNEEGGSMECFDDCIIFARDVALAHIAAHYGDRAPAPGLVWEQTSMVESIAREGSSGELTYQFIADGWVTTVSYPIGGSGPVAYSIEVIDQGTSFQWKGTVDAHANVTE